MVAVLACGWVELCDYISFSKWGCLRQFDGKKDMIDKPVDYPLLHPIQTNQDWKKLRIFVDFL